MMTLASAATLPDTSALAAAEPETDSKGAREPNKETDQGARDPRKNARTGDDLDSCRRDADGMRGPERSRFMTQCLRERK
jgi:hypothetical protein